MFKYIRNILWSHSKYSYIMVFKYENATTTENLIKSLPKFRKWLNIDDLWDWSVLIHKNYAIFYTGAYTLDEDSDVYKLIDKLKIEMDNGIAKSSKWIRKK